MTFFEKAIEAASDETQRSGAQTFRANALDMLGRYAEAVAAYEEVIAETPEWWEAHANLGHLPRPQRPPGEGRGSLQAGPRRTALARRR